MGIPIFVDLRSAKGTSLGRIGIEVEVVPAVGEHLFLGEEYEGKPKQHDKESWPSFYRVVQVMHLPREVVPAAIGTVMQRAAVLWAEEDPSLGAEGSPQGFHAGAALSP